MLKLHLIRHGQTNWNAEQRCQGQSDSVLTEQGKLQAATLRAKIDELGIVAVYTSSNVRTRQTTDILAKNIALPVTAMDEIREIRLGSWEKKLWADIIASHPKEAAQFRESPHLFALDGAETLAQCRDRGVMGIEKIIHEQLNARSCGDILVVSHGAILKALMTHYVGLDMSTFRDIPSLDNCSHSILEADASGARNLTHIAGVALENTNWARP